MNGRALLVSTAVAISVLIAGCSSGPGVTIAITTPPPANLPANLTASIAATVTNDPTNSGVDWGCTPVGACGTFAPAHTASGAMTVYMAPGAPGNVVITAASTKNPAVHQQVAVTIGQALTIQITTPPPANMTVNQSTSIAATVTNDPASAGVDWTCTPVGTCGTFTPAHTASGALTTYMAPGTAGPVVITAASTTAPAVHQQAPVTVGSALSINITTPPPANMGVNLSASIAATVANDPSNAGVDWSCTPVGTCGTFTPAHTASAALTTYMAPATAGAVVITAASTATPAIHKQAAVNVLSLAITTPPPASLELNLSARLAATVTNDPANAGVDWSCTPVGACGTFTPAHTASGAQTSYMAPRAAGPVVITAASTTVPLLIQQAPVNITPIASAGNLVGTYTFFANGTDAFGEPYSVAGSVVLGGAKIMGEQDYFDLTTGNVFPADPIVSGSLSVGSDGRGSLSLTPTSAPPETFSITIVNNKHILITEFDTNAAANGSFDFQTAPTSVPTGGNAFALFDAFDAYTLGGVLTSSGSDVTASEVDDDVAGVPTYDFALSCPGCTITAPDAAGRGTIILIDPNFGTPVTLAYYVVGPEAFDLIESDSVAFLTGAMYGQGAGGFSAATLAKPFAFAQSGLANSFLGVYAEAGQFTGDGTSALSSGVADTNFGDGSPVEAGSLTAGSSYFVHANGYAGVTLSGANTAGIANLGVYLVDPAINVADPNNPSGGGGAVLLDLDTNSLGIGIVAPQAIGAAFVGNYAFDQNGFATLSLIPYGLVGQIVSSGTSFTGFADYNQLTVSQTPAVTVTGPYAPDAANPGRATAQVTINGAVPPNNVTTYQASNALLFDVDIDATNIALGIIQQQQ